MPRSRFAKRSITIDQSSPCPLLQKLPLELRITIWRHVLADRIIHDYGQTSCPLFRNAWEQYDLSRVLVSSKSIDDHPGFMEYIKKYCHWSSMTTDQRDSIRDRWRNKILAHGRTCQILPYYDHNSDRWITPDENNREPKLNLSLLRTCRKVYLEAHDIFWKHNTFSFQGWATWFHDWVANRTSRQKKLITSIHLAYSEWWLLEKFRREIVAELTDLRELHFLVYFRTPFRNSDGSITISNEGSLDPFFRWFQCLNLSRVGVVVSVETHVLEEHKTYETSGFTLQRAVDHAEDIRLKIIPPRTEEGQVKKKPAKCAKAFKRKSLADTVDVETDSETSSLLSSQEGNIHQGQEARSQRERKKAAL